jgi:hypothetical protein
MGHIVDDIPCKKTQARSLIKVSSSSRLSTDEKMFFGQFQLRRTDTFNVMSDLISLSSVWMPNPLECPMTE